MKNLKVLFILLLALPFCMSCNNDDDNGSDPIVTDPLHGKWTLININGGFAGTNTDFDEGVIVWDFNVTTETIVVTNNYTGEAYDGLDSGTYPYELVPNTVTMEQCSHALEVTHDGMVENFGCHTIDGSTLTVSQIGADGFELTFKKVAQ